MALTSRFLLDAEQPIPPLEDEVWFRWRFYYEPQVAQKLTRAFCHCPSPISFIWRIPIVTRNISDE